MAYISLPRLTSDMNNPNKISQGIVDMPSILLGLTRNLGGFPAFFVAPLMRNAYFSLENASYSERGRAEPKVTVITHKLSTQIVLKFQKAKTV